MSAGIERARAELEATRVLIDHGHLRPAVSRAYYAAFAAAEAALTELGEVRAKHSGVISAFGRLVVKEGGLDPTLGRSFRLLFAERGRADHADPPPDVEDARAALADATHFVDAVEEWIAARGPR